MTKIYTAKELAAVSDDLATIEAALEVITADAHAAAITGKRHFIVPISRLDHFYAPIIKRLGELGYKVEIFQTHQLERSHVSISW